jgi:hypothetical protein
MLPRAQLKRAYLDVDFLNQPKIRGLARAYGRIAQLCLIDIYLAMSKATRAQIDKDALLSIVEDFEIAEPEQFIAYCIDKGLIQVEGAAYSNSVVIRDQEQYAKKLKIKSDESDVPGKNLPTIPDSPGNNPTIPGNKNGLPDNDNDSDNDTDNEFDLGSKKDRLAAIEPPYSVPAKWATPECLEALDRWHRKLQSLTPKRALDDFSVEALCKRFETPEKLSAALVYTCSLSKAFNVVERQESGGNSRKSNADNAIEMGKRLSQRGL